MNDGRTALGAALGSGFTLGTAVVTEGRAFHQFTAAGVALPGRGSRLRCLYRLLGLGQTFRLLGLGQIFGLCLRAGGRNLIAGIKEVVDGDIDLFPCHIDQSRGGDGQILRVAAIAGAHQLDQCETEVNGSALIRYQERRHQSRHFKIGHEAGRRQGEIFRKGAKHSYQPRQ